MSMQLILNGNALDVLKDTEDECFNCVITSPPYWGLRDYGLEPIIWENTNAKTTDSVPILCSGKSDVSDRFSDSRCAHTWGVEQRSAGERKGEKEHGDYGSKEVFEGRGNRPTSCGVSIPQL